MVQRKEQNHQEIERRREYPIATALEDVLFEARRKTELPMEKTGAIAAYCFKMIEAVGEYEHGSVDLPWKFTLETYAKVIEDMIEILVATDAEEQYNKADNDRELAYSDEPVTVATEDDAIEYLLNRADVDPENRAYVEERVRAALRPPATEPDPDRDRE